MATILTKKSDTSSSVPLAADLTNAAGGAELAVNTSDKRLYTKTSGGSVVEVGTNPSSLTLPNGTANGVPYLNGSKVLTSGSALTFDGTNLGIGTSSPTVYGSYKTLEVRGTGGGLLQIGTGASTAAYLFQDGTNAGFNNIANGIITFGTNNTERARIDTSGNLLVGTTSFGTTARLQVLGASGANFAAGFDAGSSGAGTLALNRPNDGNVAVFYRAWAGAGVGGISITSTNTSFNTSSDYRLKENIAPMTGALAKVAALKPVTYTWKSTGEADEGFIAHELQEVCPSAVTGEKDAVDAEGNPQYQGIDTSFLVATLTAALQEAHGLIKDLQSRVDALEAK